MMIVIPAFLSIFFLTAIIIKTIKDAIIVYRTVGTASSAEIACGKNTCPMPMESVASTIQLPTISPIAIL